MLRIAPTGNATFDAVEVTAYGRYQQTQEVGASRVREIDNKSAEIAYLYTCWNSAVQQFGPVLAAGSARLALLASTTKPLDPLKQNLATMLRDRGVTLPTGFFVAQSATVASGGSTNAAVVGDILTLTTGASTAGAFITAATFTVATVDAGPIPVTVTIATPGFYRILPVGNMSTTVNTALYTDCTLAVTFVFQPVTYNF